MAFPGTYDINYYKGDTLEFRIYPKDSNGDAFPLSQYVSPNGTTRFTIATSRGTTSGVIQGYAQISNDQTHILCAITPANGALMTSGTEYVYDVEIARTDAAYDYVYTLLTGTISVTEQVTPSILISPPNPVENVVIDSTGTTIDASWSAPGAGATATVYDLYLIPYDPAFENTETLSFLVSQLPNVDPFNPDPENDTSFSFTQTTAIPLLTLPSTPLIPGLGYIYAIVARNEFGSSTPVGNFNVVEGTIDPVILLGGS